MGEPDKINLQAALEGAGWRVERRQGDIWWAHEVWSLTSEWSPVGARVTLTLLVDPQSDTALVSDVWAITASHEPLTSRSEHTENTVHVRKRWPERMKDVVALAETLRPQVGA
jgi:hypothetical protein